MPGNALEKIRRLVELDSLAVSNESLLNTLHQPANMGMHARLLAVTLMKEASLYGELIQQGCDEGLFHTDTPLECAEFILAAVQFLSDIGIYPWANEDLVRRSKAFPVIIESLLKASNGSFQFLLNKF